MSLELRIDIPDEAHYEVIQLEDPELAETAATLKQINAVRRNRGMAMFRASAALSTMMENSSLRAVQHRSNGTLAGYVIADIDRARRSIAVKDLYVGDDKAESAADLTGFLLGEMIIGRNFSHDYKPERTKIDYGKSIRVDGRSFQLPGEHFVTSQLRSGDRGSAFLRAPVPSGWNGIKSLRGEDPLHSSHLLYARGQQVAELAEVGYTDARVIGEPERYDSIIFAAIAVLNRVQTT